MKNKKLTSLFVLLGGVIAVLLVVWWSMADNEEPNNQDSFESDTYLEDYRSVYKAKLSDFESSDPLALSELVTDFRIIKLSSSTPEALLSDYAQLFLSENYIGVAESQKQFKLFDKKNGQFIRTIGNIGRGPGEYSTIYDAVFDEPNGKIYLNPFATTHLFEYDLQGNYIKTIDPQIDSRKAKFILADSTFTLFTLPFPSDSLMACRFKSDGKILSQHRNRIGGKNTFDYDLLSLVNGTSVGYFARSSPMYYRYDITHDSIYPCFAIDQEDMVANDYSANVLETKNSYLISILKVGKKLDNGQMVDKLGATGEYMMMDSKYDQKRRVRIYNDFFFGIPVDITWFSPTRGEYFQNFSALELKYLLQQAIANNELSAEQKSKAVAFERLIGEDDNNYIFCGRLIN